MSDATASLNLPYILPDQSQKHVTHNEALQLLDTLAQIAALDIRDTYPASPAAGDCYLLVPGTAAGASRQHLIIRYEDGAWTRITPRIGWLACVEAGRRLVRFTGTEWISQPLPATGSIDRLGIYTQPDANNRLSVNAAATLLNHEGAGHQLKINRANDQSTGSLLFQTGFSGRAELGLLGDANFGLKFSQNGASWLTALTADAAGIVRLPNNPACRASLNAATLSPAAGSLTGFQAFSVNRGNFTLGTALAPAPGNRLVVPASGLYMIHLSAQAITSNGHTVTLLLNDTTTLATIKGNAATVTLALSRSTLANLNAGDSLTLQHAGVAQLEFGPGKTEIILAMI